jgi:methylphosphotriester-DNA--protein-cysteine methyltransferase
MQRFFGIIFILLLLALALGMDSSNSAAPRLLSQHSRQTTSQKVESASEEMVVITPEGKLFHKAGCRYIHGKPEVVTMAEAIRRGYTPCTRCERELLKH